MKRPTMAALRRQVRHQLQQQLEQMLLADTKAPDGSTVTVLDDIIMRTRAGYGYRLNIQVTLPDELARAHAEAVALEQGRAAVEAGPLAGLTERIMSEPPAERPQIEVVR